jgi:stage IV sporulation protein FB
MWNFNLNGIPVRVQFFFWLSAFLLGGGLRMTGAEDWVPILLWTAVMFGSILVHEMGHALASRFWGGQPKIELHGLGGVTYLGGLSFTRWQHLAITAAGPALSLILGLLCAALYFFTALPIKPALEYGMWINFFWTAVNLLPILPMDGGQILRDLIGPRFERAACVIGMLTALAAAYWFYGRGLYIGAVMMVLFAWFNLKGSLRSGGVQ